MTLRVLLGYSRASYLVTLLRGRGIEAFTCDLRPADHPWHLQGDVWDRLGGRWDAAILHPVCTYLTCSAAWAFKDGPYHQQVKPGTLVGAARREARAEAQENFRRLLALPIPHIAIENPAPSFVSKAVEPPTQTIQPYDYGEDRSKRTGFWLRGLPNLRPTQRIAGRLVEWPRGSGKIVERWANQTDSGQSASPPSSGRWADRSLIGPTLYDAMAEQWIFPLMKGTNP